jgi:excisionase family DNA binding protein
MPEQWISVAEAASLMKVHPRTIERRIAAGKIDSRRGGEGQVQVLITVPEEVEPIAMVSADAVPNEAFETVKEMADRQVDLAAGTASALVRVAQEQAMRAENQLMLARQDAGRYRRESKWAVGMFVALLVALIVGVSWCTQIVTSARADRQHAIDQAERAADDARQAKQDLTVVQAKSVQYATAQADAQGELKAYKTELTSVVDMTRKKPATTQPTGLIYRLNRLSEAFAGE